MGGFYYYDAFANGSYKSRHYCACHSCTIQIKVNEDSITIVYSIVANKLDVIYFHYYTLNSYPIIHNTNDYLRLEKNYGNDHGTDLPDYR